MGERVHAAPKWAGHARYSSLTSGKVDLSANADAFTAVPRAYLARTKFIKKYICKSRI